MRAAHGTTVGQLDPDQLYYLRARGLALAEARRVLARAFARDIVDQIAHEGLREEIGAALHQEVHGRPLVYLDNGASAQVPRSVADALTHFHLRDRANVHRGVHTLSQRATTAFDAVRAKAASFLGVADEREVVFTTGTTGAINLVAWSWGRANLGPGDEVLVSEMEHHSNIVPWQIVCEHTGATVRKLPITERGELDLAALPALLTERTKLVALVHVSNALGTVNPVREVIRAAHQVGARVLLDGAQAVPHMPVDVTELGCDFYAWSGRKLFGPTGVGVLWGRSELLEAMPPWQGGGDMIEEVCFSGTTWNQIPFKFEAGTPHIAGVIGLGAALNFVSVLGMEQVAAYEAELGAYAQAALEAVDGVRLIGTAPERVAVFSFVVDGAHPLDVGTLLDLEGIAVRTGHHCAQPAMRRFGIEATVRASFALYNTAAEADALVAAVAKARRMLVG